MQNGDQIAVANHLDARYLFDRSRVHRPPPAAVGGGPQDPGLDHSRQAHVRCESGAAGHFGQRIAAQVGFPADGVLSGRLEWRQIQSTAQPGDWAVDPPSIMNLL